MAIAKKTPAEPVRIDIKREDTVKADLRARQGQDRPRPVAHSHWPGPRWDGSSQTSPPGSLLPGAAAAVSPSWRATPPPFVAVFPSERPASMWPEHPAGSPRAEAPGTSRDTLEMQRQSASNSPYTVALRGFTHVRHAGTINATTMPTTTTTITRSISVNLPRRFVSMT